MTSTALQAHEVLALLNELETRNEEISGEKAIFYDAVRSLCSRIISDENSPEPLQMYPARPLL
jgi:hypothetical protein